jgi:hypothetical protein
MGLVFQLIVPPAHPLAIKITLVAGGQSVIVPVGKIVGALGTAPILSVIMTLAVAVQPFTDVPVTT